MLDKSQFQLDFNKITKQNKSVIKTYDHRARLSTQQNLDDRLRKYSSNKKQKLKHKGKSYYFETQYQSKPDLDKMLPTNIMFDKEKLYSELIIIKRKFNSLSDENYKLKTQLKMNRQQKVKLMSLLEDSQKFNVFHGGISMKSSQNLMIILKDQLRKEKQEKGQLLKEVQKMKKQTKISKMREIQIQNLNLKQQIDRLNRHISQFKQNNHRNKIKQQQIYALEEKIIERDQQLSNLKLQYNEFKVQTEKNAINFEKQQKKNHEIISKLNKQIQALKSNLSFKQQKIMMLTKMYQSKHKSQIKPKKSSYKLNQTNKTTEELKHKQQMTSSYSNIQNLRRIGQYLNLKLRGNHLSKEQIILFLLPNQRIKQGKFKRAILNQSLLKSPFQISLKLERDYLINYLFKTQNDEQSIQNISKRFFELIGPYKLDTKAIEDKLFTQVCEIVYNCSEKLAEYFIKFSNTQNTIKKQDLIAVLKKFEFKDEHIIFMLTQIAMDSVNMNLLNFYSVFDLFNQDLNNYINPVEQLSEEYERSNSNININKIIKQLELAGSNSSQRINSA